MKQQALLALHAEVDRRGRSFMSYAGAPFADFSAAHQQWAVDGELTHVIRHLIANGWTPADLFEVFRRNVPQASVEHVLDVAAAITAESAPTLVHPQWHVQLEQAGPRARWAPGDSPARQWTQRSGRPWTEASASLIGVMVLGHVLPKLPAVLPVPGRHTPGKVSSGVAPDTKVLNRIRALLSKAESTDFPEEAEAFSTKAQELMTQYSIDRAMAQSTMAQSTTGTGRQPVGRRVWLDNPYLSAKYLLVSAVADANHCRAVMSKEWGFVTLVGDRDDLDGVELLSTSLLVQATRAMTAAGSQINRYGASRTRSFRQSFLVAYAQRIGERLSTAVGSTEATADAGSGGALLPALVEHARMVDTKLSELFPRLVKSDVSVSNPAGYGAGRAAADLAQLGIRGSIADRDPA